MENVEKSPLIELKGVQKQFIDGKVTVLDDIDLVINKGDMIVVTGPSGSGKSTLLYLISVLDVPTRGKVFFEGRDTLLMTDDEKSAIRSRIGFVFQDYNLINAMNAIENVEIGLNLARKHGRRKKGSDKKLTKKAISILNDLGLGERVTHIPEQLSGGEKQRVAIARAIAKEPSIIVGDEPTGNLDSENGQKIIDEFKKLNAKGHTILIVTHNPTLANIGNRRVKLLDGKIED